MSQLILILLKWMLDQSLVIYLIAQDLALHFAQRILDESRSILKRRRHAAAREDGRITVTNRLFADEKEK